jgi:hypothetical protein
VNFIESYKESILKFRIFSMVLAFLIAFRIFGEVCINLVNSFFNYYSIEYLNSIIITVSFQLLIALLFTSRFILLWVKTTKSMWYSQLIWLCNWFCIFAYNRITNKIIYGSFGADGNNDCIDCSYYDTFHFISDGLLIILLFYMVFSPVKQVLMLVTSFFNRK